MTETVARHVIVHGRVQGVFYRDTCRREAQRAGVAGWVLNASDGTVHAHLEGPSGAVDRVVAWTWQGPPHAHVDHVEVRDTRPAGLTGFEVR